MTTNTNPKKTVWLVQDCDYSEDSDGSLTPLAVAVDRDSAERELVETIADLGDCIFDDRKALDGGEVIETPVPGYPDLTRMVWSHELLEGQEIWIQEFELKGTE